MSEQDGEPEPSAEGEGASSPDEERPKTWATDDGDTVAVNLSDEVAGFLDAQVADDPDRDRADVLHDLAVAHRSLAEGDAPTATELSERLEAQRAEYVELVEDVRERVVEVAREADGGTDDALVERVETLEADLQRLADRVEGGFENYEAILTEVTEAVNDLGDRADTLASTVVSLRETTLADETASETDLDRLRRRANRAGVSTGDCDNCGNPVDVALLTTAECPHCEHRLVDVRDDGGLFGSPTLVTVDPPALSGDGDATNGEDGGDGT